LQTIRKASLLLLYYFVRGTLSPSFTPCKGDNIPLDPGMPPSAVFIIYLKVNAVAQQIIPHLKSYKIKHISIFFRIMEDTFSGRILDLFN